ncbi:hypothetical protein TNCT_344471 [Trichonephila clavata]|uniref:Uncharacterized protein n=1 Tax=Trichonephila clavata TaxID=2740835 RepID=A0A8X6KR93_TRICU|nr:hypothetical protein TNCT_344471 [Trichonephila clavata]
MGNQKNKSRSQKRKFTGNRYTERNKPLDVTTVSEQKLSSTSVSTENIASKDDKMSGHRIFDVKILRSVFLQLLMLSLLFDCESSVDRRFDFWLIFRYSLSFKFTLMEKFRSKFEL